jgi:hypothetical protein
MTQPDEDVRALDSAVDPVSDDPEAPEADALDQALPANPAAAPGRTVGMPLEANEADVAEQSLVVEDPDEDYR